jgi:hypothetical protein
MNKLAHTTEPALYEIPEGIRAIIKRWNRGIDSKYNNIGNLVNLVIDHQLKWQMPDELLATLSGNFERLQTLSHKCRSSFGSPADREERNTLLSATVHLCTTTVKIWAYAKYSEGVMTAEDVHSIGFLLPGERGGHHSRKAAINVKAEVKVKIINEDFIRAIIDNSEGVNAGQTKGGWPPGVRNALIVIIADDGKTEVKRIHTTRLHNDIQMPEGSHGKQFIIKASFMRHVNDTPRFGNEQTFSMPLTTEDLLLLKSRHDEEKESYMMEIDLLKREVERLKAELNAKK